MGDRTGHRGPDHLDQWTEADAGMGLVRRRLAILDIRRSWEEHQSGTCNLQYYLWGVLMFQTWLEAEHA